MKTYTHPTINLPAGAVEVKFYDDSKSGSETTPDIIEKIGDVEEGFEFDFGTYRAPSLDITVWDKNGYALGTLLNTKTLRISVLVDGEVYFFGMVDLRTFDPAQNLKKRVNFTSQHIFTTLKYYLIDNFYTDISNIIDGPEQKTRIRSYFRFIAQHCHLKNFLSDDIVYSTVRKYAWDDGGLVEYELKDVLLDNDYWYGIRENRYDALYENAFQLFNCFMRDFLFFPSVVYDGSDFKLKIREKDYYDQTLIGLQGIKSKKPEFNYLRKILIDLKNRPEGFDDTDIKFKKELSFPTEGEEYEVIHTHTNIDRSTAEFATNLIIYVKDDPNTQPGYAVRCEYVRLFDGATFNSYHSFHEAFYQTIKSLHYDHYDWYTFTTKGLKGGYSGSTKLEYLMPTYRFEYDGYEWYIRSVRKSLEKNETEIKAIKFRQVGNTAEQPLTDEYNFNTTDLQLDMNTDPGTYDFNVFEL